VEEFTQFLRRDPLQKRTKSGGKVEREWRKIMKWGVKEMMKLLFRVLAALLKFGIIKFEAVIDVPDDVIKKVTKALEDKKITSYEVGELIEALLPLIKE